MEVENPLFVEESSLPRGHAIHFHVMFVRVYCTWGVFGISKSQRQGLMRAQYSSASLCRLASQRDQQMQKLQEPLGGGTHLSKGIRTSGDRCYGGPVPNTPTDMLPYTGQRPMVIQKHYDDEVFRTFHWVRLAL